MKAKYRVLTFILAASACVTLGFSQTPSTVPPPSALPLKFEVATIKPHIGDDMGSSVGFGTSDRFKASNNTVKRLLQWAGFNIPGERIFGGPKWVDSARFDIEAKLESDSFARLKTMNDREKREALEPLIQNLLAERLQFRYHWELRELPAYALTVAKGGPRLQAAAHPDQGTSTYTGRGHVKATDMGLSAFADLLTDDVSPEIGFVIVDRTGLTGVYDFDLKWSPENGASSEMTQTESAGPSLFSAIQEQLGLKLESAKAPVKVLVIDRLEMPSEN